MADCPQCGNPIRDVPAGISKLGKPYNAFQVCSNRACGWKPGANKMIVESALPSKVPQQNGDREGMMLLSYRKDLMVALINKFGENNLINDIVAMHREYWSELTNPMGKL